MMIVPMESSPSPSSRELAQRLFKKNVELESGLRRSAQLKVPSDPNAWLQMRENYETIILEDHEFAEKRDVENLLWQLHYRRIEEYRQRINAETSAGTNASPGIKGPSKPDSTKKIRSGFKLFLTEATGFYHELMLKIKAKFRLPLSYLNEGPDIVTKDVKRSAEFKKGLVSCHRCLIYLGDLARYKELYGKGDSFGRDFKAASSYYMQATSLCPSNGNPHHQLAILASYTGNELMAIYRYFRSLAVELPFSTAKDNLIVAFEKNRKSFSQLPVNMKIMATSALPASSARGALGKGDTLLQAKDDKIEFTNEKELSIPEVFKTFCMRFVRLNGILFTRTGLETFGEIFSALTADLHLLLSSGPKENLNFGSSATENALMILRLMAIIIFTVHNVKMESENQSHEGVLQHKVLLENVFSATFEFANYIFKRCIELDDAASSFLLPTILVFIEWLACNPDIAVSADMDVKQAGFNSFFRNQCIPFLNKLISSGPAPIDGNENEGRVFNINGYDGGTGNFYALWEDFELRGFLPLVSAQKTLDFLQEELCQSDESIKYKRSRVQRILAAGRSLMNIVPIDPHETYLDPNLKKYIVTASFPTLECLNDSGFSSMSESNSVNQPHLVSNTAFLDTTHLSAPSIGVTQTRPNLLVEGEEEEEEEIVFKPTVPEKHKNSSVPTLAAYDLVDSAQEASMCHYAPYIHQNSSALDHFQISTAVNGSSLLHSFALGECNPLLQSVNPDTSKCLMRYKAFLSDGMKNSSMMENKLSNSYMLRGGFINVQNAGLSSKLQISNQSTVNALSNQSKIPAVMVQPVFSTVDPAPLTSTCLAAKMPATLPSSRKNPTSRPERHIGPPPGFEHLSSEQQNISLSNSVTIDQHSEARDFSWVEDIVRDSSFSQSALLQPHVSTSNNAAVDASSFAFPMKQVPDVQAHVLDEQNLKHFQLFHQLNPYAEKQLQQANLQQEMLPEQHQAQSLWSGLHFLIKGDYYERLQFEIKGSHF